jgi:shikimate dehydrogenase
LNLSGVNLTIPHKEASMPFLDEADEEALTIGAVNTITNTNGILTGHNTDGRGFSTAIQEQGIILEGCRALIIGAGGASRAIGYYLSRTVKSLHIYNRTYEKAVILASFLARINGNTDVVQDLSSLSEYDIIINATSLGMKEDDPLPFDVNLLLPFQAVCDLIYRKTPLLMKAEQKGCRTTDGLAMLLWQGAYAFELWTGMHPPIEVMRTALLSIVK